MIRQLHGERGLWDRLVGCANPPLRAFAEIGESGEPGAILSLLEYTLSNKIRLQQAALNAVAKLIAHTEPKDYLFLDEQTRWYLDSQYQTGASWEKLDSDTINLLVQAPNGNLAVGFATFHRNGYVRQAAAQALSGIHDGSEIPFLLIRINDWVDPVREAATRIVFEKIKPEYSRHFLRYFKLADRLRGCGRANEEVIKGIETLLKQPEAISLLKEGVASKDRWLRRQSFRLAVESQSEQRFGFLLGILSDPDPILRLWSARQVLSELSVDRLREMGPRLMRDPLMSVRCAALDVLVKRLPEIAVAELQKSLTDTHLSVRELARYHLVQRGWTNFDEFYIKNLNSKILSSRVTAVFGLGETGNANHVSLLIPFLADSSKGIQKAAIKAIGVLDGAKQIEIIQSMLKSDSTGVSKCARLALEPFRQLLDFDQLWETSVHDARLHVRKNALLLLFSLTTWSRLKYIIMACAESDPKIAELARQHLGRWRQRSTCGSPPDHDVEMLRELLPKYEQRLDKEFVRQMKFLIKTA